LEDGFPSASVPARNPGVSLDRLAEARRILGHEASTIARLSTLLDGAFERVVELILRCEGNVLISGVGKPFFIAQKISASLASTGTPSIPLHPVEALHGDLGRVSARDVVIVLSNSGASAEIVDLVPAVLRQGAPLIAITGNRGSPLARQAREVLFIGAIDEPCHLGLTPTSSTTAMLALGDALTLVLSSERGFREQDYAALHPGGSLGRRLRPVSAAMRPLERSAVVTTDTSLTQAIRRITGMRAGAAYVVDEHGVLIGIFTDGDLRRAILEKPASLSDPVGKHMTAGCKTTGPDERVSDALEVMHFHQIDELPVVDAQGKLLGHLDIQDGLR
jgi:arabinose-5-phosphate isomerase